MTSPPRELRLAVTVENYDDAVRFYRDALGLPVIEEWAEPAGSGAILQNRNLRLNAPGTLQLTLFTVSTTTRPRVRRCTPGAVR